MARLAEQLGHLFAARALLTIAIADDPDRAELRQDLERLSQGRETAATGGKTFADVVELVREASPSN